MFKFITKRYNNNRQEKSKFAVDNFVFCPKTTLKIRIPILYYLRPI